MKPEDSIQSLPGIGPAKAEALLKAGIKNINDFIYYFPRRYLDRSLTTTTLMESTEATFLVEVQSSYVAHGRKSRLIVRTRTLSSEALSLLFFRGVNYFKHVFKPGMMMAVSGRLEFYQGAQLIHPDYEILEKEDQDSIHTGRIVPVYPQTDALKKAKLDSRAMRRLMHTVFFNDEHQVRIDETIPDSLLKKHTLLNRKDALKQIHFPENSELLNKAKDTLKYEELFLFASLMRRKKQIRDSVPRKLWPLPFGKSSFFDLLIPKLSFKLTEGQMNAVSSLLTITDHANAFLLQGDVGSGKTIVSFCAALHYIENSMQVVMMAPTEVLARQHFRTITDYAGLMPGLSVDILTAGERKKDREMTIERIRSGQSNFIIGTHALIEPNVEFESLGFVIVDEQHRFGVGQRDSLREKGQNPDLIAMTATPIPRSLCLTLFADLEIVTLKEKPSGRGPVKTMWLEESKRAAMYKSVEKHVSKGRQCYFVYPVIDESEKMDLKAATEGLEELKKRFPDFQIAIMHGRMKSQERQQVMNEFRAGRIQILVATTVIEVGIDVPNATIMVIEHADRFGLSQLHQLRGRVGRGTEESFCVLMAGESTEDGRQRLETMTESSDGFYLSEVDMQMRGPGELLGLKQHGLPDFRLADFTKDRELTELAYQDSKEIKELPEEAVKHIRNVFEEGVVVFPN